ncbi:MAG: diacylglycerol/lipid kinase family protein [Phycisphaerales bacterium]
MKLVIVFNPISGRGEGPRLAQVLQRELGTRGDGHEVVLFEVGPAAVRRDLVPVLEGQPEPGANSKRTHPADGLIVIGGDGTVHSCAKPAAVTSTPLYHFPTGTENLFAREFGMDRDLRTVRAAIDNLMQHELAGRPMPRIDLAECNGRSFLLMASVGVDANIVNRLCRKRTGRISHFSYAPHILAELIRPWSRPMTITVDGQTVVERRKGMAVVANSRQYAMRVDPAQRGHDRRVARCRLLPGELMGRRRVVDGPLSVRSPVPLEATDVSHRPENPDRDARRSDGVPTRR